MVAKHPMKLLVIAHDFGRLGAQMVLLHLLKQLKAQFPQVQTKLLARHGNGDLAQEFHKLAPTQRFWSHPSETELTPYHNKLREEIQQWAPDIVFSNTAVNGDVIRFLDLKLPLIVNVHEMSVYLASLDKPRMEAFQMDPTRYLAASIAVTNTLVQSFQIREERIKVLYESIDCQRINDLASQSTRLSTRQALGISANSIVVGSVGRIDHRKGWDLFAEAGIELLRNAPNDRPWRFLWLGHGPDSDKLKAAFAAAGYPDSIIAPGPMDNPFPIYMAMDIYVQASREDPCPVSVLEAAYLGLPIVVFGPSGGAKEVVDRGCGIVLDSIAAKPLARAIQTLGLDPIRAKALGSRGPAIIAEHHDARQAAVALMNHLEETLAAFKAAKANAQSR